MKKNFITLSTLAIALVLLNFAGPQGCVHRTPAKTAVLTLAVTAKAVNDSYSAYLDGILSGQIKTNNFPKISAEYREFQRDLSLTVAGISTNGNAVTPPALLEQSSVLLSEIANSKKGN